MATSEMVLFRPIFNLRYNLDGTYVNVCVSPCAYVYCACALCVDFYHSPVRENGRANLCPT